MVDRHLEYLGLLELRRTLLLERRRDQSAQFGQRVVDAIATSLLDDAASLLSVRTARHVTLRR